MGDDWGWFVETEDSNSTDILEIMESNPDQLPSFTLRQRVNPVLYHIQIFQIIASNLKLRKNIIGNKLFLFLIMTLLTFIAKM